MCLKKAYRRSHANYFHILAKTSVLPEFFVKWNCFEIIKLLIYYDILVILYSHALKRGLSSLDQCICFHHIPVPSSEEGNFHHQALILPWNIQVEVFWSMKFYVVFFWVVRTEYSDVVPYQRLGGSCCFFLHPEDADSKDTTQKTTTGGGGKNA
jgi:hypothetical protein